MNEKKKLILIAGATASGKTSCSIKIAQHFNTKILSFDSRQCYKELNIGVAKPSQEELNLVEHYFINSHSIQEEISAGDYERFSIPLLETLFENTNIVVAVGGTGLYAKAIYDGFAEMPSIDLSIKNKIETLYKQNGLKWLQDETLRKDIFFEKEKDIKNASRLLRALIFFENHGVSISSFQDNKKKTRTFEIEKYAIDISRNELYEKINSRVDNMWKDGLLEEVKNLKAFEELKNLQTIGYKEVFSFLKNEIDEKTCIEKIKQHTRNYAKRQLTWFKHQDNFEWISADNLIQKLCKS
ncbi:MAG: tRNA (adenosine(37)-N6)-dimethylallyltransferase MiaA [Chitinophagaceae bacterium]|nr:tRNA (adenosine(37)-N6)-dimethylallyltransferase MiaA [Chitinophagaceae bacterium]